MSPLAALPAAAYYLFLEAGAGGAVALLLVHVRGEVSRGFTLFTGWCFWGCSALAVWLRLSFPPPERVEVDPIWLSVEVTLGLALAALLLVFLLVLHARRIDAAGLIARGVVLVALGLIWVAALTRPSPQLLGIGHQLALLAGSLSLGSVLAGLSLGHWYLVAPSLSVRPLVRLTFVCLGAVAAQLFLQPLLLLAAPGGLVLDSLLDEYGLFFAVRVLFGLVVPVAVCLATWRTARIRSLDSATGLLYVAATLILVGEISARTLYFLTGAAT